MRGIGKEVHLEDYIVAHFADSGYKEVSYKKGTGYVFDRAASMDVDAMLGFIKESQADEWKNYCKVYPNNPEKAFTQRLESEISNDGLALVLQNGFKDRGCKFVIAFARPESGLNKTLCEQYGMNRVYVARQFQYSDKNANEIDIVLLLNGLPIVTMELKSIGAGQSVSDAINQYKADRDPREKMLSFNRRSLIHFALDTMEAFMTTKLEGKNTLFLPFNQGSNGAGNAGKVGNPINKDGKYKTYYLWEDILQKDNLLDLVLKYLHFEKDKQRIIFPRFHQFDVVRKLLTDVKKRGTGQNYLIQHSAGSGKSNSIMWLAHRLSSLHNDNNEKIFASVVVVTDRKILDQQLQANIYNFNHKKGVVKKVESTKDLIDAVNNKIPVIITTLHKFQYILEGVSKNLNAKFAIIADEAHSSQGSSMSDALKNILRDKPDISLDEYENLELKDEASEIDTQDKLVDDVAVSGKMENLSFFAFTATPKAKTLEIFGEKQEDGTFKAFHVYSMQQAVDEGFILDVLRNYTTYKSYYKISKIIEEDPKMEKNPTVKAVAKFISLHPTNISQKTQIIIEHFRNNTRKKIGGKAKAMLVTASRLHALKYFFEFKDYIKSKNYNDLDILVAFSGSLIQDDTEYTEERLNKTKDGKSIREDDLASRFNSDFFNILIVADKYQTGFDEPFLHTMYIDKKITGVKAVQTLSRVNRICNGKNDTFILDFVNDVEDIKASFETYFTSTILSEETDPNIVYNIEKKIQEFNLVEQADVDLFNDIFYSNQRPQSKLDNIASNIRNKWALLDEEKMDQFKKLVTNFINIYSFISQIHVIFDKDLHKLYNYFSFVVKYLFSIKNRELISDKIDLKDFDLQRISDGLITLEDGKNNLASIKGGSDKKKDKEFDALSAIIEHYNSKYGRNISLDTGIKPLEQILIQLRKDSEILSAKNDKDVTIFNTLLEEKINSIIAELYQQNSELFNVMLNDVDFMHSTKTEFARLLQN